MAIAVATSLVQLFDNSGDPLNGGSVTVYQDGTTTLISLFSDDALSVAAANPITLDSAGRHDMRYFAAEAYKILIKNSAAVTIFTRDDIDPGIPIGSGLMAVANGGTGAGTAAGARTNLGAASTAELAVLSAEVASLSGVLGSTDKTHIATGTTAQRPVTPIAGDIRHNTTTGLYEAYYGAAWDSLALAATQAVQETGTDLLRMVTPGRQHFHASAAKFWCKTDVGTTVLASYNVTSIADGANGVMTVTIATDFSGVDWCCVATVENTDATIDQQEDNRIIQIGAAGQAGGTVLVAVGSPATGTGVDPTTYHVLGFGDQA